MVKNFKFSASRKNNSISSLGQSRKFAMFPRETFQTRHVHVCLFSFVNRIEVLILSRKSWDSFWRNLIPVLVN